MNDYNYFVTKIRVAALAEQILLANIAANEHIRTPGGFIDREGDALAAADQAYRLLVRAQSLADKHNFPDEKD